MVVGVRVPRKIMVRARVRVRAIRAIKVRVRVIRAIRANPNSAKVAILIGTRKRLILDLKAKKQLGRYPGDNNHVTR